MLIVHVAVDRCCPGSRDLKAPWSDKTIKRPVVTVTDEAGNKANVTLFNIWAGKVCCRRLRCLISTRRRLIPPLFRISVTQPRSARDGIMDPVPTNYDLGTSPALPCYQRTGAKVSSSMYHTRDSPNRPNCPDRAETLGPNMLGVICAGCHSGHQRCVAAQECSSAHAGRAGQAYS